MYVYVSEHSQNAQNDGKQSSAIKQLLETLLVAINMYTSFNTDVIWRNTRVCSVTNKPSQNSSS